MHAANDSTDPASAKIAADATSAEAADAGQSPETLTRTASSTRAGTLRHLRRQSTNERISEILDTARGRAEGMGSDPTTILRRHPTFTLGEDGEEAADETTGIVGRGSSHNYQALSSQKGSRPRPIGPTSTTDIQQQGVLYGEEADTDIHQTPPPPWWTKAASKFRSVELENKGSVARDHLALERTFLAWLRTSLAFASIGIAVTQLFRLNRSLEDSNMDHNTATLRKLGKPLGSSFLGISILILLLGFKRYFHGQEWIIKGKFPASRGTIILVALVGLAIMVVSLVVVIVIHPADDGEL